MKSIALALFLLAVVTGCARHTTSEPSASPGITDRASCEAAGGKWNVFTKHCKLG
jgi:hypothetical protein